GRMKRLAAFWLAIGACNHQEDVQRPPEPDPTPPGAPQLTVTSEACAAGGEIMTKYTCQGENTSPALAWTASDGAKSYALIVDDPDAPDPSAPKQTWVHWVVSDLPATTTSLPNGASTSLPAGAQAGKNDFGKLDWGGPCPPIGRHRYVFKVYALDT